MGGDETIQCRERLHGYLNEKKNKFIMDMSDVEWINSQGLGLLIGCYVSVKKAGGNMALTNIDTIRKILEMTRLISLFDLYDNVEEAKESFRNK